MEKKKAIAMVGAILVATLLISSSFNLKSESDSADEINFKNTVFVYKNGKLVATAKNTVTNIGKNHTRDVLNGIQTTGIVMNVLELSTDTNTPSGTETTCPSPVTGNGLDAGTGTVSIVETSIGNYSVEKQWTATGTQTGIAKVCIQNGTVNEILFGSGLLSPTVSVASGDTLTVTYYVAST